MENQNQPGEKPVGEKAGGVIPETAGKTKILWITLLVLVIVAALGGACFFIFGKYLKGKKQSGGEKKVLSSQQIAEAVENIQNVREKYAFPKFNYKKSNFTPSLPEYKISLEKIANLKNFDEAQKQQGGKEFSQEQKDQLIRDNFFVAENRDHFWNDNPEDSVARSDDWSGLYTDIGGCADPSCREPDGSVFITTDFLLHSYHRLLEKEFEYIEQKEFYPKLQKMSEALLEKALSESANVKDPEQKTSLERVAVYFAVPSAILETAKNDFENYKSVIESGEIGGNANLSSAQSDSKDAVLANLEKMKNRLPSTSFQTAQNEIELVMSANTPANSPLLGKFQKEAGLEFPEDYTQFNPRSHYSKNPILRTYFRSMMWYGRMNFLLASPELTRDALNIAGMIEKTGLGKDWEDIYVPTAFFVGESDDLGIVEYREAMKNAGTIDNFNQNFVANIQAILKNYKNPKIMSSIAVGDEVLRSSKEELQNKTKGFRFMGQRFTPDAFVFSTLTQGDELPDPETGESLPSMPTALMVAAAMGNKTAGPLLDEWENKEAPSSKQVIAKRLEDLKGYFESASDETWTQNIYWGWLYTIKSLFQEDVDKTGYPMFMKMGNWNFKNLAGSLGSWTELKHDTLLYAKQSYSELGGMYGEGNPPVPKGYVEPNIEFFDRLIPLAVMTKDGLAERELLPDIFVGRNEQFLDSLEFLRKIAISELGNENISDDDFERLRTIAHKFENIMAALPDESQTEDLARSALIADVHTDAAGGNILYEATGIPNHIYVAVEDKNGTRLTKGLVFSYYEFKGPLGTRLKDEDWRGWVYKDDKSQVPPMPDWEKSLIK